MEYDSEFVRGKNLVKDFITPDYRDSVNIVLRQALNGQESANFGTRYTTRYSFRTRLILLAEFPLISKSGRRIEVLLNATPRYDARGVIVGGMSLHRIVYHQLNVDRYSCWNWTGLGVCSVI